MSLTDKSCFYFRFISQIVFSFLMSGVGTGLVIKDWENKGSTFVFGLMMVSNVGSAWFLNPRKPKTFKERYRSMTDLLKLDPNSSSGDVQEDDSDLENGIVPNIEDILPSNVSSALARLGEEIPKPSEIKEKLVNSIPPPPPPISTSMSIPSPIPPDSDPALPILPTLPILEGKKEINQKIDQKVKEIGIEIEKLNSEL